MKVALASLLLLGLALAGCDASRTGAGGAGAAAPIVDGTLVRVRLLAFNDFHGQLQPTGLSLRVPDPKQPGSMLTVPTGGAAALAGTIRALRQGEPHSVVVSAGDLIGASPMVSSLFRDEPTVVAMNAIGLDLNALGNHEFDRGVAELRRIAAGGCAGNASGPLASCADPQRPFPGASFGFLAANVIGPDGRPLFPASVVRNFGGVRVGFIGLPLRGTPNLVSPSGVAGIRFGDEVEAINREVAALTKVQGVEAIVVIIHEGGWVAGSDWNDTRCESARGPIFAIADALRPEVDLIVSGHTHQGYNCVRDVPGNPGLRITQAGANARGLTVVDLVLSPRTGDVDRARTRARNIPVVDPLRADATVRDRFLVAEPDAAVAAIVERAAASVAPRAGREIGRLTARADRNPAAGGDSVAGRLVADAQLLAMRSIERGGAVIAFMNPGGLRADFACSAGPSCPVSFGEAFTVQPFGNSLVAMTLTGAQVRLLLEQQWTGINAGRPRILQPSAGFSYSWSESAPAGAKVRDLRLNGAPILPQARYRVSVNSFLAEGGDGFDVLTEGSDRVGGPLDLDAMVEYLEHYSPVTPPAAARITRVR